MAQNYLSNAFFNASRVVEHDRTWTERVRVVGAARTLEELADATLDGTRKATLADLATVPLLIVDHLGMRTASHRRRRSAGADHASLRTGVNAPDLVPAQLPRREEERPPTYGAPDLW